MVPIKKPAIHVGKYYQSHGWYGNVTRMSMVISEMDNYNPYRFFWTQKFGGSYEMFILWVRNFRGV